MQPGLLQVARQVVDALARLGQGRTVHRFSHAFLTDNPYWPPQLADCAVRLDHERYVVLMPLALSRTQDDKGRVRWTLFGGSEQGPSRAFWQSFFVGPGQERPPEEGLGFFGRLLTEVYGEAGKNVADLGRAGFRVLRDEDGPLPHWTAPFLCDGRRMSAAMRYLLTFRPFDRLPPAVRRSYLAGELRLLPFPGSLIFWGVPEFVRLRARLPLAGQIPLQHLVERHAGGGGIRVPQSGWMHEPGPENAEPPTHHGPLTQGFRRTHRHTRVQRDASHDVMVSSREDQVAHVLFDSSEAIGLYGKPMARNAQLWSEDHRLVLDGPLATPDQLTEAARVVRDEGGLFGYRFQYPAMRVGRHEVYWHRPLVAYLSDGSEEPKLVDDAPTGYLTAYLADKPDPSDPVELWPRLLRRPEYRLASSLFANPVGRRLSVDSRNCHVLLETHALLGGNPLPRSFARRLLSLPDSATLDHWLDSLPAKSDDPDAAEGLVKTLKAAIEPEPKAVPESSTFSRTARRAFELSYWKSIAAISTGRFPNRNTADCSRDPTTRKALDHDTRDLKRLGDFLLKSHARSIKKAGMTGRAFAGDLPFHWRTDFPFDWSDGWRKSQGPEPAERDLIVVIPGRDRSRAIVMADHYDTAYMEDRYQHGRSRRPGPRLATPGSDDNTSATAALLMAAPVLLELSRDGNLGCDVWLIHLTGEEFPADCLGARFLSQSLVEGTLAARRPDGSRHDLSSVRVGGVYVLDMVAHDNPRHPGVFQIAPGTSRESMRLALHAHLANEAWNGNVDGWNRHPARQGDKTPASSTSSPPPTRPHPIMRGEVRPHDDTRSTLYNSDGQVFSDAGIPVVLFMEDYDINRSGYHDSHDTMAGIDLDYGSALTAIAIEAVARATQSP